jgi:hypothetical protein
MSEEPEVIGRALRQNEVCKTLITIDLAVVAATLSILGSSRPITFAIGLGAGFLVASSIAFVVSMVFLINAPDTNGNGSRHSFMVGLGLSLIGYGAMGVGFYRLEPPERNERISIEAQAQGMILHVPNLCRQAVTATLPSGQARIAPPPGPPDTGDERRGCLENWRLEAELQPGGHLVVQPTP